MYCIKCGGKNVNPTSQEHQKVLVERGEFDEQLGSYTEEFEAIVLECGDCGHEMIDAS